MKRTIGLVAICVLLLGVSIQAQAQQGPPKPGPEVKRLAYFVGNWKEEGKSTAHGMAGPVSSTQKWEWVSGGFFIVGHSDNKSPVGDFEIMAVLGYDPETKMYLQRIRQLGLTDHGQRKCRRRHLDLDNRDDDAR